MDNDIMVSVCCLVYNHEKYLRKCLDGFIMQKTNFKFEVLIHDDASTDNSAEIIREYEERYPDIIKPIYQKENQYSKGIKIGAAYQYPRTKGKYIALCEGDDYWCDENKLQMQFDEMENDIEISMCVHRVRIINENGNPTGKYYPKCHNVENKMDLNKMMNLLEQEGYPFHTSSYFLKKSYVEDFNNEMPNFKYAFKAGDKPLLMYMMNKGYIAYIDKCMSCWRAGNIGGWTSKNKLSSNNNVNSLKREIAGYLLYDIYLEQKYTENIYNMINDNQFLIYMINGNYKNIVNKRFKIQFQKLPLKQRIYYHIVAYMPILDKIYRRLKSGGGK